MQRGIVHGRKDMAGVRANRDAIRPDTGVGMATLLLPLDIVGCFAMLAMKAALRLLLDCLRRCLGNGLEDVG